MSKACPHLKQVSKRVTDEMCKRSPSVIVCRNAGEVAKTGCRCLLAAGEGLKSREKKKKNGGRNTGER